MAKALLIIDMLRDFLDKDGALSIGDATDIIKNVASRVQECREEGNTIIYIMDRHLPEDAEFEMFAPHCLDGEPGSEIIGELTPGAGDLKVYKRRYSAFFGTGLDLSLRERGITEVELVGVCTNICVLYTAADARMLSYDVTVRKKCVDSFDKNAHEFALGEMEKTLGVNVL